MPITIGKLTSNVSVTDADAQPGGSMIEEIVQRVLRRLRAELRAEQQALAERQVRDRMSESEPLGRG